MGAYQYVNPYTKAAKEAIIAACKEEPQGFDAIYVKLRTIGMRYAIYTFRTILMGMVQEGTIKWLANGLFAVPQAKSPLPN